MTGKFIKRIEYTNTFNTICTITVYTDVSIMDIYGNGWNLRKTYKTEKGAKIAMRKYFGMIESEKVFFI